MHLDSFIVYCCTPKALYNRGGGGGLSSTTASVQHPLQLLVERRESHRANQVDGDYWEAMIDKGQWWEFGQDTGVTPYSLREVP